MIYRFNQFSLDTEQYRLFLSDSPIAIEPLAFDLLVYLIEHRERVVSREELLDKLWKGKVVTDAALGARLKDARQAVQDSGKKQGVIKTLHGRGYQFIAEISEHNDRPVATTTGSGSGYENSALTEKLSIAVLPFNNLSNNPEQDYICDCIAEDIIASLCCYREMFVIDHHSTLEFRDVGTDAVLFAKELGVEYLTKGSIRQSKDQIRISVQLIEAATGKAVWADRIDRKYDDLFAIEDEISARIASSLVDHIEDESSVRAMRKHPENMTAFDCVMRARRGARSYDPDQNAAARLLLEKAISLDPEYAAAYAYLSGSYIVEADAGWSDSREDSIEKGIAFALKAVSLDDFDAGNHAAMGAAYMYQKKFELAEVHLDRAIECNPNSYGAFCAKSWVLALSGRASEVAVCGSTALQLNPLAPDDCLLAIIIAHYIERKYDAALEMIARVRVPYGISEVCRAACLVQLGRDDEAREAAISAVELGGNIIQQGDWFRCWPFKNPGDLEDLMDGLQKAALLVESSE